MITCIPRYVMSQRASADHVFEQRLRCRFIG